MHFNVKFLYYDNGHYNKTFKNLYISELEMQDRTLESMVYSVLNDNREFYQETKKRLKENFLGFLNSECGVKDIRREA